MRDESARWDDRWRGGGNIWRVSCPAGADGHPAATNEEHRLNIQNRVASLLRPSQVAHAHCDIPCGIYHPHIAQQGGESVERMMVLIGELGTPSDAAGLASLSRYVAEKEKAAELVKHEVRILWGDYFKPPHLEMFPDLHDKVWNIMKLAGACKVGVSIEDAKALRAAVDEFADMFWKSKE
jgi:nickel superoxide dismutase